MNTFVKLFNGHKMPLIGFGTAKITDVVEAELAFEKALSIGYRHFDTAFQYGNENILGNVLKRWLGAGKLKREDLFIVTKLPPVGMRPHHVGHYLDKSLKNLQLDYIDMYLIHQPVGLQYINDEVKWPMTPQGKFLVDMSTDLEAIWGAMETQVDQDKTRSIGISNFAPSQVSRMMNVSRIQPANLQVELNAGFQQKDLQKLCRESNITICAYSPIGSPGRQEAWINGGKKMTNLLIEDPVVLDVAKRYSKTPAQILLRFLTQKNIVCIPKSGKEERIRINFQVLDFQLTPSDMEKLESLDKGEKGRQFLYGFGGIENHPEFKLE